MNMLTSLKALLFSSAAAPVPADGAGLAVPVDAADFAALLNGTMDAAPQSKQATEMPGVPQGIAPILPSSAFDVEGVERPPARAEGSSADNVELETPTSLPFGLANALKAVTTHRKDSLPPPPGLARKVEVQAAPIEASPPALAEPAGTVAPETSVPVPVTVERGKALSPELAFADLQEQPQPVRPVKQAGPEKVEALPEAHATRQPGKAMKTKQGDEDKPREATETEPLPLPVIAAQPPALQSPSPQPLPSAAAAAPPAPREETPAVTLGGGKKLPAEALLPPQMAAGAQVGQPRAADAHAQPAQGASKPLDRTQAMVAEAPDNVVAPADLPEPAADGPVKSEALALLQLVRDQVTARRAATPARAGEPLAAHARSSRAASPVEVAPAPVAQQLPADAAPQAILAHSAAASVQPTVAASPGIDLSASLGAQMVDMGVSGQWIDHLARDIAGLSATGAQGRFQISADQLGPVQVDIRHGTDGAAVSLTVASEAAEIALRQDSDRLKLDAGLSAVRIAEVKIERSPQVAEAARSDSANQQSSQQQHSSQQQPGQGAGANGQNMSQSQGQGRWQARENSGLLSKNPGDPAVLNHDDARRTSDDAVRARYA